MKEVSIVCISFVILAVAFAAPNNGTSSTPEVAGDAKPTTPNVTNSTSAPGNNSNSSDEDCDAEPEPTSDSKNETTTKTGGDRQGKQLNPGEMEKYEHDPAKPDAKKANATTTSSAAAATGEKAKLQATNSTTAAPAAGGTSSFTSSTNVILATLILTITKMAF